MTDKYAALTETQIEAIHRYIETLAVKRRGQWKAELEKDWYHARLSGDIHGLRNTHGFDWLRQFKLPAGKVSA